MLNDSEIHIWFRRTNALTALEIQTAGLSLSAEERSRRDRLVFPEDRRDFAMAHDLLRRVLSKYHPCRPDEWSFSVNSFGKPSICEHLERDSGLNTPSLIFSLSHTRSFVACAVAVQGSIGVDVETLNDKIDFMPLAQQYYSPTEAMELSRCMDKDRVTRFTELWTLKEAFLKARGVGLSGGLDSIVFPFREDHSLDLSAYQTTDQREWRFALYEPADAIRLSVASCGIPSSNFSIFEDV